MKILTNNYIAKPRPTMWTRKDSRCPSCNVKTNTRHKKACELEYIFDGEHTPKERNKLIIKDVIDICSIVKVAKKWGISKQRVHQIWRTEYPTQSAIDIAREEVEEQRQELNNLKK